jgi:hypothetical protein
VPGWVSGVQAHSRVSNINFYISKKHGRGSPLISHEKYIKDGKVTSLIYFSWDIYRNPPSIKKVQISKLKFDTLLWALGAETNTGT